MTNDTMGGRFMRCSMCLGYRVLSLSQIMERVRKTKSKTIYIERKRKP